jgi:DNA-binding protein H-NS
MPRGPALKSMSIDKLVALRDQVEATIAKRVIDERHTLEAELGKLSRYSGGGRGKGGRGGLRGSTVAAKYRNPDNPSETWAGRGLKPRWLVAALKSGGKIEDFAIAGGRKDPGKRMPKKTVRMAKR